MQTVESKPTSKRPLQNDDEGSDVKVLSSEAQIEVPQVVVTTPSDIGEPIPVQKQQLSDNIQGDNEPRVSIYEKIKKLHNSYVGNKEKTTPVDPATLQGNETSWIKKETFYTPPDLSKEALMTDTVMKTFTTSLDE